MTLRYVGLAMSVYLGCFSAPAQLAAQDRLPYTLDQLLGLVESGVFSDERIAFLANRSCLGFELTDEASRRLQAAGASVELMAGLRGVCVKLLTTVQVLPTELVIPEGASRILRARTLGPDSSEIPNVPIEWSSEDTTVAEVSMGGVVQGKTPGITRVNARVEGGPHGGARVQVTAAEALPAALELTGETSRREKSAGTAAALGVVLPGGGQFYAGKPAKGAVVLVGAAGSLAAGYLLTSEEVLSVERTPTGSANCDPDAGSCVLDVRTESEVEETRRIVIGAAVAGAFWLYGLIDGIRSARSSAPESLNTAQSRSGPSLELAPAGGLRVTAQGDAELTLVRIRS